VAEVKPFEGRFAGAPVLVTGSTGFKGAWLCAWLARLGARVSGAALAPTTPSLFDALDLRATTSQHDGDIRDPAFLERVVAREQPRVVLHLAAQALVRASYDDPVGTFATNVQGTVHLLEAVRRAGRPCAVLVVTSDKCYENVGWEHGYRETDGLGGHDPYSASKACAELVAQSYRRAFFAPAKLAQHQVAIASARAGNVIGPGDWAKDRIVPDAVRALSAGQPLQVRAPRSTRPWQHVLDALSGYLALTALLLGPDAAGWAEAWNFGPTAEDARPVRSLADAFCQAWSAEVAAASSPR
jgi:CDP-glucose 4,6-dehydratase